MKEHQDHYFSAEPATPEERRTITVRLGGRELRLTTAKGVYSPDRLDPGTAILLADAPDPSPTGALLDIGCGWGPIAITLGLRSPEARIWGVDVNRRSLDLARSNAAAAGLDNVTFCEPGQVPADLVQPAHPRRQGGPPRHPCHVAAPADRRRRGPSRRAEAPRLGLAPEVDQRPGLGPGLHAALVIEGLPHPRGPAVAMSLEPAVAVCSTARSVGRRPVGQAEIRSHEGVDDQVDTALMDVAGVAQHALAREARSFGCPL